MKTLTQVFAVSALSVCAASYAGDKKPVALKKFNPVAEWLQDMKLTKMGKRDPAIQRTCSSLKNMTNFAVNQEIAAATHGDGPNEMVFAYFLCDAIRKGPMPADFEPIAAQLDTAYVRMENDDAKKNFLQQVKNEALTYCEWDIQRDAGEFAITFCKRMGVDLPPLEPS